ncbi:spermidine synthase [Escherichia coli]|uniref:Spermidine synthase n=1 Tax=Escherichia coli TaxID=562 RepID=A0A376YDL4_ECOLX|nr:spermidine synthase [Escherichia coli]
MKLQTLPESWRYLRRTKRRLLFTAGRSHRQPSQTQHYFSDVGFYQAAIPTYYGGIMTFAWATDNDALRHLSTEIIQARFLASGLKCRYYNPAIHTAAFALPQYLQDALASQPS